MIRARTAPAQAIGTGDVVGRSISGSVSSDCAGERLLDQIVGSLRIPGQHPRVAAQTGNVENDAIAVARVGPGDRVDLRPG